MDFVFNFQILKASYLSSNLRGGYKKRRVLGFQGFEVLEFEGFKVSRFQGLKGHRFEIVMGGLGFGV